MGSNFLNQLFWKKVKPQSIKIQITFHLLELQEKSCNIISIVFSLFFSLSDLLGFTYLYSACACGRARLSGEQICCAAWTTWMNMHIHSYIYFPQKLKFQYFHHISNLYYFIGPWWFFFHVFTPLFTHILLYLYLYCI